MDRDSTERTGASKSFRLHLAFWLLFACGVVGTVSFAMPGSKPSQPYEIVNATREPIERTISAVGTIRPRSFVDVGAQVSGQLKVIHYKAGDQVNEGDLLAEIDAEVQSATVDGIQADLDRLKAELLELDASLEFSRKDLLRASKLLKTNVIAESGRETAEREFRVISARIQASKARIRQTEASLRAETATMRRARITAPMTGTIVSVDAKVGQTLNANYDTPLILRIADLTVMTVEARVSEADISKLSEEMPVWFTTLGEPNRKLHSAVKTILPAPPRAASKVSDPDASASPKIIQYHVLFDVTNTDFRLRPDMTAQVNFIAERSDNALVLPIEALPDSKQVAGPVQEKFTARTVQVLERDGRLVDRPIDIGIMNRFKFEIRSGLSLGEQVVTGRVRTEKKSNIWFEL